MHKKRRDRENKRRLAQKERRLERALLTLVSTGFFLAEPLIASTITPTTNHGPDYTTNVSQSGNVYTIAPGKNMFNGDKAFNRFENFSLKQGHVANMKFENGGQSASQLYNFVRERIDVNGTVNALKNGTIGGHMFFVSPKGMTVGASGVINAGRFTGIAAKEDFFESFMDVKEPWASSGYANLEAGLIPLNRDGTITVQGRITAPGGIRLAASRIGVGTGAALDTTTTNFTSLVNAKKADGTYQDWGVTGANLSIDRDGSGDIYLVAQGTTTGSIASTVTKDASTASIDVEGTITAFGSATLKAQASNGVYDLTRALAAGKDAFKGGVSYADVKSDVKTGSTGKITASGDVTITAESLSLVEDTTTQTVVSYSLKLISAMTPFDVDAAVAVISSDASVRLDGTVTAGKSLDVSALSSVSVAKGAEVTTINMIDYEKGWSNIPALAVTVGEVDSASAVTIGGSAKLKAGGAISIQSESDLTAKMHANAAPYQVNGETQLTVAATVTRMSSTSKMNVEEGASLKSSGTLSLKSLQKGSVTSSASAGASNKSPGSVSVNVSLLDTDAQVNVSADIGMSSKPASLTIQADNTISKWTATASSNSGSQNNSFAIAKGKAKAEIIGAMFELLQSKTENWDNQAQVFGMSKEHMVKAFQVGGSLNFVFGSQNSSVNLAQGKKLKAGGDVILSSSTILADHLWKSQAQAGAGTAGKDQTSFGLALTWAQPSISSGLTLAKDSSVASDSSAVTLSSSALVKYSRFNALIEDIQKSFDKLTGIFSSNETAKAEWAKVTKQWEKTKTDFQNLSGEDLSFSDGFYKFVDSICDLGVLAGNTFTALKTEVYDERIKSVLNMKDSALAFLDATNYANTSARALAASGTEDTAKLGLAAALNVNIAGVTSGVYLKPGASVSAVSGLTVRSAVQNDNVAFGGNIGSLAGIPFPVLTDGTGIGGTVIVQDLESTNDIEVQQGAALKVSGSSKALVISADESSLGIGAALSAGVSGKLGVEGEVSVLSANVKNRIRIDDQAALEAWKMTISAANSDIAQNVAGAIGVSNGKSIGIAAAINALDYQTLAKIADFDSEFAESSADNSVKGILKVRDFTLSANGTSNVNSIALAAEVATSKSDPDEKHWYSGLASIPGKINQKMINISKKIGDKIRPGNPGVEDNLVELADLGADAVGAEAGELDASGGLQVADDIVDGDAGHNLDAHNPDAGNADAGSSLKLGVAGSAAWNSIAYDVQSGVENVAFQAFDETSARSTVISANNSKWNGAFTGGVAVSISTKDDAGASVGVGGALSVNDVKNIVTASVKSADYKASTGSGSDWLQVFSSTGGETVAGALGVAVTSTKGLSVGADAGVSANLLTNNVTSVMDGVKRASAANARPLSVDVSAQARDTQVTGGVNLSITLGDKSKAGVGASIEVAHINNTVAAKILNSSMSDLGSIEIDALDKITQITAGLTLTVSPAGGSGNSFAYGGVFAVGVISNTLESAIENSTLTAGGPVILQAKDTSDKKSLAGAASGDFSGNLKALEGIIDSTGESYTKSVDLETKDYYTGARSGDTTTLTSLLNDGRSIIVTAAAAGSGSGTAVGTGAAVSIVKNRHETRVTSSDLTARSLAMDSANGVQLIGVAAGAAVGTKGYSVNGSVVWSQTENTARNTLTGSGGSKSQISVGTLSMDAKNDALTVGVTGQIGMADKTAIGASFTYGKIENNALNLLQSADITSSSGAGSVKSASAARIWDVAGGASVGNNAVAGSVALSRIKGSSGANLAHATLSGFKDLSITASDSSAAKTLTGSITAGFSKASAGGAVSYAQIGQICGSGDGSLNLSMKDSSITMAGGGALTVSGTDSSTIDTLAAGVNAGTAKFAFQGSVAVNLMKRDNALKVSGLTLNASETDVWMGLNESASVNSIAAILTANFGTAGVGAAVSVNRLEANNVVEISGGTKITAKNAQFCSKSAMNVFNIGAGGAYAPTAGITGSVGVNILSGTTAARFYSSSADVTGSLGLTAQSDNTISSYLGGLTGSGTAAIGVLTAVNVMGDKTEAVMNGSAVTASGNDAASVDVASSVPDDAIFKYNLASGFTPDHKLAESRSASSHKGLVVDSSATHSLVSNLLAGGFAGTADVLTSVNVSVLSGHTKTLIENTSVNASSTDGDVHLRAADYANQSANLLMVSGSGTVDVTPLVDVNTLTRTVESSLSGISSDQRAAVHAGRLSVTADSKLGIVSLVAGAGGSGGAAIGGSVSVANLSGTTLAQIKNVNAQAASMELLSSNFNRLGFIAGSVKGSQYLGMGVAVGVVNQKSSVGALMIGSALDMVSDKSGPVVVSADNRLEGYTAAASAGAAMYAGTAATVSVNNMTNAVTAAVRGSRIGSGSAGASSVTVASRNAADVHVITGSLAGGIGGVGVGVNVNQFYNSTQTEVSGSQIYSGGSVQLLADEIRSADQEAYNAAVGGVAVGANVIVTTFGKACDAYSDENHQADIASSGAEITEAFANLANPYLSGEAGVPEIAVGGAKVLGASERQSVAEGRSGQTVTHASSETTELTVIVANSAVRSSSGDMTIRARESGKIIARQGSGSIGAASVSATVGVNNLDRKAKVLVSGSTLTSGGALSLNSVLAGTTELNAYQGSAASIGMTAVYSGLNVTADSSVTVNGSSALAASGDIVLSAQDASSNSQNAYGVQAGAAALGALVSRQNIGGTIATEIASADINSEKTLTVESVRTGTHSVTGYQGTVAGASGVGVDMRTYDNSGVKVSLGSADSGVSLSALSIDVLAQENSIMKAETKSLTVGGIVAGVALAEVKSAGSVTVTGGAANAYSGSSLRFRSIAGGLDESGRSLSAVAHGYGGSLAIGFEYNRAETVNLTSSSVNVSGGTFASALDVTLAALNSQNLSANVDSFTIDTISLGNNKAVVRGRGSASASLTNSASQDVKSLSVSAKANIIDNAASNGDGGGIIVANVGVDAAHTVVDVSSDVSSTLGGIWTVSDDLSVTAAQSFTNRMKADATKASVIGASATELENTLKGNTSVQIAQNSTLTAGGALTVTASNSVQDGDPSGYVMSGNGYGGITGAFGTTKSSLAFYASADIGSGAKLGSGGALIVSSRASGTVAEKSRILSAGLINGSGATATLNVTYGNSVSVGADAELRTLNGGSVLILSANDASTVDGEAVGDLQGAVAGGATSRMTQKVTRRNSIELGSGSLLLSAGDTEIYAGKDVNGGAASLNYTAVSHAYAHGLITGASASLNSAIDQKNTITVGGAVRAVGDVSLSAAQGFMQVVESVERYAWYSQSSGAQVVTTALGDAIASLNADNGITLTGSIEAGQRNAYKLNISGTVLLGEPVANGVKVSGDVVVSSDTPLQTQPTLTGGGSGVAVTTGSVNYSTNLFKRWQEVCRLIQDYYAHEGSVTSSAYLGYVAEKQQLEAEMKRLNIAETNASGDIVGVSSLMVQCVEVAPVYVSGGSVAIDAGSLTGSGSITAHGKPEITIENDSNLYLVLDGLNVEKEGGEIRYNNVSVADAESLKNVVTNGKKTAESFAGTASADAGSGNSAITVTNSWDGPAVKVFNVVSPDVSRDLFILPDISVQGSVINNVGDVTLKTVQGSIVTGKATIYAAGALTLDATNGAISQYSDGMISIAAKPEDSYKSLVSSADDFFAGRSKDVTEHMVWSRDISSNADLDAAETSESAYVAGGGVFLTADTLNVNGLIQSGFGTYSLDLTSNQALLEKIAALDAAWNASGRPRLPDSSLGNAYTLTEGSMVKNGSDYYDYAPGCKYNPSTQSIVVEDINAAGGNVYLTGRIINTSLASGNAGRVVVFDGAADVSLSSSLSSANSHGVTFQTGSITLTDRVGLVTITDTAKPSDMTASFNASGTYSPVTGQRYNWTAGTDNSTTTKVTESQGFTVWGLFDWGSENVKKESKTVEAVSKDLAAGSYITSLDAMHVFDPASTFMVIYDNAVTSSDSTSWTEWKKYDNWTHFSGTAYRSKITTTGSKSTKVYSVKADNPIAISVLSSSNPDAVKIESTGTAVLGGTVKNAASGGTVTVSADRIESRSSASIMSDRVALTGTNGIGGESPIIVRSIGGTTDVSLNSAKGAAAVNVVNGALNLNAAAKVAVEATAHGNISGSASALRIELASETGAIGSSGAYFSATAGQLADIDGTNSLAASFSARAASDVYVRQTAGDLRVGSVVSTGGDVTLESPGSIQNANPYAGQSELDNKSLTTLWTQLGLFNDKRQAEDIANLAQSIKNEYNYFQTLDASLSDEEKATHAYYKELKSAYGSVTDIASYIESQKNTEGTDLYELAHSTAYGWKEQDLLYAVQDAILNPSHVSVTDATLAVQGNHVNLAAGDSIGHVSDTSTIDLSDGASRLDNLKKLSLANPYDVTVNSDDTFTVTLHRPVAVETSLLSAETAGAASATSGSIYVSSPTRALSVDRAVSAQRGEIRLIANDDVGLAGANSLVSGGSLIVSSGRGNVGSESLPFCVNLTGMLSGSAAGDLYLTDAEGDTELGALSAGGKAVIASNRNIFMSSQAGAGAYTAAPVIILQAGGDIGAENVPLRLVTRGNSDSDGLFASAGGSVFVQGMAPESDNVLHVAELLHGDEKTVAISSNGGVRVSCGISTPSGDLSVSGSGDVTLEKVLSSGKTLTINSTGGSVVASDDLSSAGDLSVSGSEGVLLKEDVSSDAGLNLQSARGVVASLKSLYSSGDMTVSGDGGVNLGGHVFTEGKLDLDSISGTVVVSGDYVASEKAMTADGALGVELNGFVLALSTLDLASLEGVVSTGGSVISTGDMDIQGVGGIHLGGSVMAHKALNMESSGGIVSTGGDVDALSNIMVSGAKGVRLGGEVSALGSMELRSTGGIAATLGSVESSGDMTISGDGGVNLGGSVQTGGALDLDSGAGKVVVSGDVVFSQKEMTVDGLLGVELNGSVITPSTLNMASSRGIVITGGSILSGLDMTVKGNAGIELGGVALTHGRMDMESDSGSISVPGSVRSLGDMTLLGAEGVILGGGASTPGVINISSSRGAVLTLGNVLSSGDITISGNKAVLIGGSVFTGGTMDLSSGSGFVSTFGTYVAARSSMNVNGKTGVDLGGVIAAGEDLTLRSDEGVVAASGVVAAKRIAMRGEGGVDLGGGAIVAAAEHAELDSGSSMDLLGILTTPSLDVQVRGAVSQSRGLIASPQVSVAAGSINLNSGLNQFENVFLDARGGSAEIHGMSSLNVSYSVRVLDLTVKMGGDVLFKNDPVTLNSLYGQASGDIRIGGVSTVQNATLLAGGTLYAQNITAGGDIRLHSDGSLYAKDLNSGRDIWIFGLGDNRAVLSFASATAARDAAVILKSGYLSGGKVVATRDGAMGVRYFNGPWDMAPTLVSRGVWSYYPYGGMIMPRDPFNVNFKEFLDNAELERRAAEGERERPRVWDCNAILHDERGRRWKIRNAAQAVIEISKKLKKSLDSFWAVSEECGEEKKSEGTVM